MDIICVPVLELNDSLYCGNHLELPQNILTTLGKTIFKMRQLRVVKALQFIGFIDYDKAFDSVDWKCLLEAAEALRLSEKITSIIHTSYEGFEVQCTKINSQTNRCETRLLTVAFLVPSCDYETIQITTKCNRIYSQSRLNDFANELADVTADRRKNRQLLWRRNIRRCPCSVASGLLKRPHSQDRLPLRLPGYSQSSIPALVWSVVRIGEIT